MTIIAASRRLKVMMADTAITSNDVICFRTTKIFRTPSGNLVGAAGDNVSASGFLAWAISEKTEYPPAELWSKGSLEGIMLTPHGLYFYEGPRPDEPLEDHLAVGTGSFLFNAALAAGADFETAMRITCAQSTVCAEPITILKLIRHRSKK